MTTLFFIIVLLSAIHFIYEGIIGPSIRMRLRYSIFVQRDALRLLKLSNGHALDDQAFTSLHDSINTAIRLLPAINIMTLVETNRAVERDENLRDEISRRDKMLEEIGLKEVDEIRRKTGRIVMLALLVNTAGLFLYLFPIFAAVTCVQWTARIIKETLLIPGRQIDLILSLPLTDSANSTLCAQ